ncbi:MAG: hypothetical protein P1V51_24145 [Deltaproteobacteria bacterium]|nr:hypothetical protein [Deltaproteobacteria bacterium]
MATPSPASPPLLSRLREELRERWTPLGLPPRPGQPPRLDATAWAALVAEESEAALLGKAHGLLAAAQLEDGRVPARPDASEACWTTALAALAFARGGEPQRERRERALDFLTGHEGVHHPRTAKTPVSHDTDLVGWPWIEGSAAWVEPTALALLALARCGRGEHPRAAAARALLFDRQLPGEGWNHGNVEVLGKRFRSVVASTGLVLLSLQGTPRDERIEAALTWLRTAGASTPLSLAWRWLGLAAWGEAAADPAELEAALSRQRALGPVDGAHLAQLILSLEGPEVLP